MTESEMKLETLYQLDKKSKVREWDIKVKNCDTYSDIIIVYGGEGARKIETINKISEGKNKGKSNETTHYQQACKEAISKWTKKRDIEGYKCNDTNVNINGIKEKNQDWDKIMDSAVELDIKIISKNFTETTFDVTFENSKNLNTWIKKWNINEIQQEKVEALKPMLANDYHKQKSKLQFPAFIQPKLDGYRMIYDSKNELITSRQGKHFDIIKESKVLMNELTQLKKYNLIFDGELYIHGGTFEHLGLLRKKKITEADKIKLEEFEYHIYDIINDNDYTERYNILKKCIDKKFTKIKLIKNIQLNNEQEIKENHSKFVSEGYEGSMLRNKLGGYKCKYRSNNLLKYKDFMDSEHTIIGYTIETDTGGNDNHLIVWICKNENGEFKVRPSGSHEERKKLYIECEKNFEKYKNRMLWCKYFELTDRGVPRFPTTKTNTVKSYIRDSIE
jgi:hypothetical protein